MLIHIGHKIHSNLQWVVYAEDKWDAFEKIIKNHDDFMDNEDEHYLYVIEEYRKDDVVLIKDF